MPRYLGELDVRFGGEAREAEVHDFQRFAGRADVRHHQIGGFQIAMGDPGFVGGLEGAAKRPEYSTNSGEVEPSHAVHNLFERLSANVFHHQHRPQSIVD